MNGMMINLLDTAPVLSLMRGILFAENRNFARLAHTYVSCEDIRMCRVRTYVCVGSRDTYVSSEEMSYTDIGRHIYK